MHLQWLFGKLEQVSSQMGSDVQPVSESFKPKPETTKQRNNNTIFPDLKQDLKFSYRSPNNIISPHVDSFIILVELVRPL